MKKKTQKALAIKENERLSMKVMAEEHCNLTTQKQLIYKLFLQNHPTAYI